MDPLIKVSFLISGYGSNLQEVLKKLNKDRQKNILPTSMISNNHISTNLKKLFLKMNSNAKIYENIENLNFIDFKNTNLIFSIGYMKKIPLNLIKKFHIINLHPSLLPLFKGLMTHKRMLINNENKYGFTIHVVNEYIDEGEILYQKYLSLKTTNEIQLRKDHKRLEHNYVYGALKMICKNLNKL